MTRQKLKTILGVALAVACVARPALAQTQATTTAEHRHQEVRISLPPQWPRRQLIRSPAVGCCRYSRTTTGWTCRSDPEIGCRAT